jgi:hypothetical protein
VCSAADKEWGVLTNDVSLHPDNFYKNTIQVANYSSAELTLDMVADDLLQLSENVPKLAPYSTLVVFVSTKLSPPQDPVTLPHGITVSKIISHFAFGSNIFVVKTNRKLGKNKLLLTPMDLLD